MKGTETDLGSFPRNKEVKAEPLHSTGLTFILQSLKNWEGRRQAREGWMEDRVATSKSISVCEHQTFAFTLALANTTSQYQSHKYM